MAVHAPPRTGSDSLLARDLRRLARNQTVCALLLYGLAMHMLDVVTTAAGIDRGRVELNPLSAGVISVWGISGLIAEKLLISVIVVINIARLSRRTAIAAASICAVALTAVVLSNCAMLVAH